MTQEHPSQQPWQPPEGFQMVESALEGITVFAPVQEQSPEEAPRTYICPQCGASTRFDAAAGGVACEYCGYTAPVEGQEVGRQAAENEFTLETVSLAERGWGTERQELHCEQCGANMTLEPGVLTATCPFCASNRVNVHPAPVDVLRPRYLVPFKVSPDQLQKPVQEWLGRGWYHPADLKTSASLARFNGIYLPFWTFDTIITADWAAEVGYERQERYYDASSKEWKTRTVIDWRWENGRVTLNIDDLLFCASQRVSPVLLKRIGSFNLEDLVSYQPDFLAGLQAQAYDITLTDAWEQAKTDLRERARQACYDDIPSRHVRNFSMTADFGDETWRYVLLPVYLTTYHLQGRTFQVMVNGQTGVVTGQKPVVWWKVRLAIAALLLPGLILLLLSLFSVFGENQSMLLIIGILLFAGGVVFSARLYGQAAASEAA